MEPTKIGIFGIGLQAYWPQFPGLKEKLEGYQQEIEERLSAKARVVSAGLVDTPQAAAAAGERFRAENVAVIFCYVGTYATSSQVLPAVQIPGVPVVILNLQPVSALDYEHTDTGKWLEACCACCVPEISCAFARSGIDFHVVSGMLREEPGCVEPARNAWQEIEDWCTAATVKDRLSRARIGFLGHTYPGMLDMYSDFTQHQGQLGTHIEVLEMCDLKHHVDEVNAEALQVKRSEIENFFQISGDSPSDPLARKPDDASLEWACRVAAGLDRMAEEHQLDGLTYYYRGRDGNEYEQLGAGVIVGCSLLTGRGIPCSGEGDLKNCQAMKIMDLLGAGGSFTELYSMDFRENIILMGHDGPFHVAIAEGKPILRGLGLFHGKRGHGVSVEARVKNGPITLLALTQTGDGRLKFLAAEGECVPGPVLQIGNTNSRLRFPLDVTEFMNRWCMEGPTHHCALGIGHQMKKIEKVCRLLRLELIRMT
jgi:L-arabinose isomerase